MDRRAAYAEEMSRGVARFFQARRPDCPWCGGTRLTPRLVTPDLVQRKPGVFRLDRCASCGHVFQNPALSEAGLAFYYRDFYDGLGEEVMDRVFAVQTACYRARARLVVPHAHPVEWLDVGCGHGHFCHTAAQVLPRTTFDGLDFGAGVDLARARGWIRKAYRGEFRALAPELAGRYDVVSMHHYLEHSPDPLAEIEAAHAVLRPGGLLLVELPDPESPWARLTGRYWPGWLQPQHLHLPLRTNLCRALEARGYTVLHDGPDDPAVSPGLTAALLQYLAALTPPPPFPWLPPQTERHRRTRALLTAASTPLVVATAGLSWLLTPLTRRWGLHSNFQILARADSRS
ncbi:SAM-dependent methyltransferase [Crossiella equi]|uniref:SAM-dependent methyltransferase n=2 Tax=Crossiella equi TaxID=130796 RepID=A0ABS5A8E4_9PSEU|nr:class I SAM-dependent methyltransferase [Crossiella equi]MBP2472852.1 SAM-dependent methyltransferase [Crossiella equi]